MLKILIKNDLVYMKKDPMMWMIALMPALCIIIYQLGMYYLSFLQPYGGVLQYMLIGMCSSFAGILFALRMLDEKDEHLMSFYAVSPLGIKGYLLYRGGVSSVISGVITGITSLGIIGRVSINTVIYGSLLGLLLTLVVGNLAQNKIQGMILAKATGLLVVLPCIRQLGDNSKDWLLVFLPWDYLYKIIVLQEKHVTTYMMYCVAMVVGCSYFILRHKKLNC